MSAVLADLERRLFELWRPPLRIPLSEYSERHYKLSPESSAEVGDWRCIPYQRGILDAFSDPEVETVSVMKSARVGWTKIVNIVACYYMHHDPCPIMIVQPTIEDGEGYSKEEIEPMIRDVPVLAELFAGTDKLQKILHKVFRGGSLSIVGANSPRGFRRVSRKVVLFDEIDGYPPSAGAEGDQLKLGDRRTEYYWDRKKARGSTPTLDGISRIQREYADSDQRRFYVPCPHCGYMDFLVFARGRQQGMHWHPEDAERGHWMTWPKDQPEKAHFVCRDCDAVIEHEHKRAMVEAGEWRARKPFAGHAGFHIWAAYSYSPNASWGQIATEYVDAARRGTEELKTVVNTVLGETWAEKGEAPEWELLYRRREQYAIGQCPRGALFLTCGVDVQKDSLRYEVVGWGRGKRSWSVDSGVIPGDTADLGPDGPWPGVAQLLDRVFPHECGTSMRVSMMAVDSGYNTQAVYTWCRQHPISRVIAVKGVATATVMVGTPSAVDVTWQGKRIDDGCKVWPVSGALCKNELYGWIKLQLPADETLAEPPGYCHFPEYDQEYFRQLTAEQLVTHKTRNGRLAMGYEIIPGRENHMLDARNYARAAAYVVGMDRFHDSDWAELERAAGYDDPPPAPRDPNAPPAPPPQSSSWIPRRPGWLKR